MPIARYNPSLPIFQSTARNREGKQRKYTTLSHTCCVIIDHAGEREGRERDSKRNTGNELKAIKLIDEIPNASLSPSTGA